MTHASLFAVELGSFEATDAALCGPRAASLARLDRAGLRVAPGLVVTRRAFRAHLLSDHAAAAALLELRACRPEDAEAAMARLRAAIAAAPLPADVAMALRPPLAALLREGRVVLRPSPSWPRVAGREDVPLGAWRTDVDGVEAALAALPALLAAVASPAALDFWGDGAEPEMAVLVQAQRPLDLVGTVEPFAAGRSDKPLAVRFRDPVSGDGGSLLLAPADGRVLAGEARLPFCLPSGQASLLADLHRRAGERLGFPQALDFAVARGELVVLDARPVTRLVKRWRRSPMAERFPTALTPLTWDLIGDGYERALGAAARGLGLPPMDGDWLSCVDGQVRVDQTLLDLCLAALEPQWTDLDELQRLLPRLDARHRWLHELPTAWLGELDRYLLRLGRLDASPAPRLGPGELWMRLSDLRRLGLGFFAQHGRVELAAMALTRLLGRVVHTVAGEALAPALLEDLLRPTGGRELQLAAELADLRRIAEADGELRAWLQRPDAEAAWAEGPPPGHREAAARLSAILADHGHLSNRYDLSEPTWGEAPWRLMAVVAPAQLPLPDAAPDASPRAQAASRLRTARAEARLMAMIPADLAPACRELLRLTRLYRGLPAQERYQVRRLAAPLRAVVLELGRRMRDDGALDSPDGVFGLRLEDIRAWVVSRSWEGVREPRPANLRLTQAGDG